MAPIATAKLTRVFPSHHIVPQLAKVTSALPVSQQVYELDRLDSVMEKHLQHWFSVESPSGLSQVARIVLKGWALEGAFRVKQVRFERFPSDETRADAIFAAISFIEQMKLVATSGYLRFISDDAAIVLSRAGWFFSKVSRRGQSNSDGEHLGCYLVLQ
jgi:hypothetical protein